MPKDFLKRSRSADVDVYLGYHQRETFTLQLVDVLVPNIHRLRQLHLDESLCDGMPTFYSRLNVAAPKLTSLSIISDKHSFQFPAPGSDALPSLFVGEMPALRKLFLTYYTRWPSGYFQNLTHLCLMNQCDAQPMSRPSTSEFLDFLELSPQLQYLFIGRAGPTRRTEDDVPVPSPDRTICLESLRELNIYGWSNDTITRFLSHLSLKVSTGLHIWCLYPTAFEESENDQSFFPGDSSELHNLQNITELVFIRAQYTPRNYFHFCLQDSRLYIQGALAYQDLEGILSHCNLGKVEQFFVHDLIDPGKHPFAVSKWRNIFRKLPAMTKLSLLVHMPHSTMSRVILSNLFPQNLEGLASGTKSAPCSDPNVELLCPDLETIYIEQDATLPILFISGLADARARHGKPLQRLQLVYRSISLDTPVPLRSESGSSHSDSDVEDDEFDREVTNKDFTILRDHVHEVTVDSESDYVTSFPDFGPRVVFKEWINFDNHDML
ncbi:hypothetical protein VKT23_008614 [Stygiomarasmius scandens]|uniref:F-box domain-containing protein n=1 Tax=Marasmiellus scandens TaxID=2682957 RepID=A0ABR1JGY1_9AGAR